MAEQQSAALHHQTEHPSNLVSKKGLAELATSTWRRSPHARHDARPMPAGRFDTLSCLFASRRVTRLDVPPPDGDDELAVLRSTCGGTLGATLSLWSSTLRSLQKASVRSSTRQRAPIWVQGESPGGVRRRSAAASSQEPRARGDEHIRHPPPRTLRAPSQFGRAAS